VKKLPGGNNYVISDWGISDHMARFVVLEHDISLTGKAIKEMRMRQR
jgi:hypothetical protein